MANTQLRITQFNKELLKQVGEIRKEVNNRIIDTAVEMAAQIVARTPKDTGTARKNWNFSIGNVDITTYPKRVYPEFDGPAPSEQAAATARALAEQVFGQQRDSARLEKMYIANALEYIAILDKGGSSTQAPGPWVEPTVMEFERKLGGK